MPFDWREFVDIARFLHSQGNSAAIPQEAAFRCAISRAYYAAFCHSREYACSVMGFPRGGMEEDHTNLRSFFFQNKYYRVSRHLDRLRQWRNNCDYDNPTTIATDSNVTTAIQKAKEVIATCPLP